MSGPEQRVSLKLLRGRIAEAIMLGSVISKKSPAFLAPPQKEDEKMMCHMISAQYHAVILSRN